MEVSEAQVRLLDGRENLVKARLALHAMKPDELRKPIDAGMAIAKETLQAGRGCAAGKGLSADWPGGIGAVDRHRDPGHPHADPPHGVDARAGLRASPFLNLGT